MGKLAHVQSMREHLATVVPACWATLDWSWPKEWNWCVLAALHMKKEEKSMSGQWIAEPSPQILTYGGKATANGETWS